jgi:hypothetical protein
MAFQMAFTTEDGRQSQESYWLLDRIDSLSISKKMAKLTFVGWHNAQAKLDGLKPIGLKTYELTPYTWDIFFTATGLNLPEMLAPCYQFARLARDVGEPPEDGGEDTRISFFENAIEV